VGIGDVRRVCKRDDAVALTIDAGPGRSHRHRRGAAADSVVLRFVQFEPLGGDEATVGGVGRARVIVTTDGTRVASIDPLPPENRLLAAAADAYAKSWTLAHHTTTTFELTFEYAHRRRPLPCAPTNPRLVARFPTFVHFEDEVKEICDPPVQPLGRTFRISTVEGRVTCECSDGAPIAFARVTLSNRRSTYTTQTDRMGSFRIADVRPGTYDVGIDAFGFRTPGETAPHLQAIVDPRVSRALRADIRLQPIPGAPAPPDAVVRHAAVPFYPDEARRAGIDGAVRLQVNRETEFEIVSGPVPLARSALENLRTWHMEELRPPFFVTYRYRLSAGDCTGDPGFEVAMTFPNEVDVRAKRIVPCSPLERFVLPRDPRDPRGH
jgi:hypothetical protein